MNFDKNFVAQSPIISDGDTIAQCSCCENTQLHRTTKFYHFSQNYSMDYLDKGADHYGLKA